MHKTTQVPARSFSRHFVASRSFTVADNFQAVLMTIEASTLSVHRCRFVDFTPSAVAALAFPPLPLPSVKGKKSAAVRKALKFGTLAVGRANGNIELCEWTGSEQGLEAPQAWVVTKVSSLGTCSPICIEG